MARTAHGNQTIIKQDGAAGTLVDISSMRNSAQFERSVDTDPDLAFGERSDGHTIGLEEAGNFPLSGSYSPAYLRHCAGIWQSDATKTIEYNPAGTTTGRRKQTCESILTSIELSCDLNSTSTMATDHKLSGAIAFDDN